MCLATSGLNSGVLQYWKNNVANLLHSPARIIVCISLGGKEWERKRERGRGRAVR